MKFKFYKSVKIFNFYYKQFLFNTVHMRLKINQIYLPRKFTKSAFSHQSIISIQASSSFVEFCNNLNIFILKSKLIYEKLSCFTIIPVCHKFLSTITKLEVHLVINSLFYYKHILSYDWKVFTLNAYTTHLPITSITRQLQTV